MNYSQYYSQGSMPSYGQQDGPQGMALKREMMNPHSQYYSQQTMRPQIGGGVQRPQYGGGQGTMPYEPSVGYTQGVGGGIQNRGPRPHPGYNQRPGYGMPSDFQNWQAQQGAQPGGGMQQQQPYMARAGWANGMMPDAVSATEGINQMNAMQQPQYGQNFGGMMGGGTNATNNQYQQYQQYRDQGMLADKRYEQQLATDRAARVKYESQIKAQGPYRPNRFRIAQPAYGNQFTPGVLR